MEFRKPVQFGLMNECDIADLCQERENLRLPKRNNLKRKKNDEDRAYDRSVKLRRGELANLACIDCGRRDTLGFTDGSTEYCCSACGLVAQHGGNAVGYSDSVYPRAPVSARLNYFMERMSQWCMEEPPIPRTVIQQLRETYGALRGAGGEAGVSEFLNKSEVRRIVIESGLPPKKLVEKWLSIRYHLKGNNDCPQPSPRLRAAMVDRFKLFLAAWQEHPELRGGRKSLPNINFLILNFLLLESAEECDLYGPWFPQVTENKRQALWKIWVRFCPVLGWDIYTAEYDVQGRIHRIKQRTLQL